MMTKKEIKSLKSEISELRLTNKMLYKNSDNLHERLKLQRETNDKMFLMLQKANEDLKKKS